MNKIIKSGYVCEGIICESIDVDDKVFYLKKNGNEGKAIAGLILGIIGVVLSIIIMILTPTFMEEFKRQLVEQCNNGQLDQDVCEEYRKMFPSWFEFYFIH